MDAPDEHTDRRLRADRRPPFGRPGVAGGIGRLAVLAALRQRRLFCRAARRRAPRLLAARSRRRSRDHDASLSYRHHDPGDDLRDRSGPGHRDRSDADRRARRHADPPGQRRERRSRLYPRSGAALRLRRRDPVAARGTAANHRNRRARSRRAARRCRPRSRRWPRHRGFLGQGRGNRQLCPAIRASLPAPARAPRSGRRSRPGDCRDRALLAGLGAAVRSSDRLARRGAPLAPDPARAEPRGHRRHDRRADHLAARNSGRRRQLGLSL